MSKRINITCDLCVKDKITKYITFTVKQTWFSWYESGLQRKRVHVCMNCIRSIQSAAKEDRKLREK